MSVVTYLDDTTLQDGGWWLVHSNGVGRATVEVTEQLSSDLAMEFPNGTGQKESDCPTLKPPLSIHIAILKRAWRGQELKEATN